MQIGDYEVEVDGTGDVQITVEWTGDDGRGEEHWVWLSFEQVEELYRACREKRS